MNHRKYIFTLLFILSSFFGSTQISDLERSLEFEDRDAAIRSAKTLLLSNRESDRRIAWTGLANAYLLLGQDGQVLYDSTLWYCEKVINSNNSYDEIYFQARIIAARALKENGEYMKCMEYILELLNDKKATSAKSRILRANTELFSLYLKIDDLESAGLLLKKVNEIKSLTLSEETGAKNRIAIGKFYLKLKKFQKAKSYFNEALQFASNKSNLVIETNHLLAEVEKEQDHFDNALEIYNRLLEYEDSLNHEHGFIHTLLIATETSLMAGKGNFEVSKYAYQAYYFAVQLNNKLRLVQTQVALGYYYNQINNFDSSVHYLKNSLCLAEEIDALYWIKSSSGLLSTVFKNQKDFANAFFYKEVETKAASALRSKDQTELSDLLKNVHLMHQYRQEKEASEHALEKKQYYLFVSMVIALGVLGIALLLLKLYVKQRKHNRFLTEKALNEVERKRPLETIISSKNINNESSEMVSIFIELKEKMDGFILDKGYLNGDCTLTGLAKDLNTNTAYLSKYINETFDCSFNQFINDYRILDFIERLKSNPEVRKRFTLEHLASMSGFNSKSTFIRAFKKHTGITPSIFLQNLPNKPSSNL